MPAVPESDPTSPRSSIPDPAVTAEPDSMTDTPPGATPDTTTGGSATSGRPAVPDQDGLRRFRRILLGAAIARYLVPIMAIPAAAALIPERIVLLTLLRPGKEVLLAAGGIYRTNGNGQPDLLLLFLAFLPLMVGGVWVFFALGRAWQHELAGDGGPAWLERLVPADVLHQLQHLLEVRGPILAFLGRVAALPPTIMAAAAGTSAVDSRAYLVADFLGAIASFAVTVGAGWALGEAYERGGVWFTVGGIVLLLVIVSWATSWLRREPDLDTDAT